MWVTPRDTKLILQQKIGGETAPKSLNGHSQDFIPGDFPPCPSLSCSLVMLQNQGTLGAPLGAPLGWWGRDPELGCRVSDSAGTQF